MPKPSKPVSSVLSVGRRDIAVILSRPSPAFPLLRPRPGGVVALPAIVASRSEAVGSAYQPYHTPAPYTRYRDAIWQLHELPGPDSEGSSTNLRFSKPAQVLYIDWTVQVQAAIRADGLHPVMQSHLAKMPKTIAGLALLFELIDGGRSQVGTTATARAILWADYLISHAERLYSLSGNQGMTGAKLILARRKMLPEAFVARDIQRKCWTGLSTKQAVTDALGCLVDHRYISKQPASTKKAGGRPKRPYRWHPSVGKKP